jgi:hypothetical protein
MSLRKASLGAMLAVSMIGTPVLAQSASSAANAPVASSARAGAETADSNELVGAGGWFIPLLAILAIIAGILAATSGGGDRPTSP